jgi:hypothetical protein
MASPRHTSAVARFALSLTTNWLVCYLHGILERRNRDNGSERFIAFFADAPTPGAEKDAFARAYAYLRAAQPAVIYYYSRYERTIYRKLQARFPEVCSADDIEALFHPARAVDLYSDVVAKLTEWPTRDHSIKTLARYLGFTWRDANPSGAASIEWFHRWTQSGNRASASSSTMRTIAEPPECCWMASAPKLKQIAVQRCCCRYRRSSSRLVATVYLAGFPLTAIALKCALPHLILAPSLSRRSSLNRLPLVSTTK